MAVSQPSLSDRRVAALRRHGADRRIAALRRGVRARRTAWLVFDVLAVVGCVAVFARPF
jgi:hypothetical protein